jgi:cephalosporin hydroxylase
MPLATRAIKKFRNDGAVSLLKASAGLVLQKSGLRGFDVITDPETENQVIKEFHKLYYYSTESSETWRNTQWRDTEILKCPTDLFVYQEIIYEVKPDVIIEAGTHKGGSALYLSDICDMLGNGEVLTIDIEDYPNRPKKDNITYLTGSSVNDEVVDEISGKIDDNDEVLVILDSDHSKEHVIKEMNVFGDFVTEGSYMIVEDTNINGHPVKPNHGPGPMEAVEEFMDRKSEFEIDKNKEKFYMTFNPDGFLKKE